MPLSPMELGQSVNVVTDKVVQNTIFKNLEAMIKKYGVLKPHSSKSMTAKKITSVAKLHREISAQFGATAAAYDMSGSVNANYAKSVEASDFDVFYVITYRVESHVSSLPVKAEWQISEDAKQLSNWDLAKYSHTHADHAMPGFMRIKRFADTYGTHIVGEIAYGQIITFVLEIKDKKKKNKTEQSLEAKGGLDLPVGKIENEAAFSQKISELTNNNFVNMYFFLLGSPGNPYKELTDQVLWINKLVANIEGRDRRHDSFSQESKSNSSSRPETPQKKGGQNKKGFRFGLLGSQKLEMDGVALQVHGDLEESPENEDTDAAKKEGKGEEKDTSKKESKGTDSAEKETQDKVKDSSQSKEEEEVKEGDKNGKSKDVFGVLEGLENTLTQIRQEPLEYSTWLHSDHDSENNFFFFLYANTKQCALILNNIKKVKETILSYNDIIKFAHKNMHAWDSRDGREGELDKIETRLAEFESQLDSIKESFINSWHLLFSPEARNGDRDPDTDLIQVSEIIEALNKLRSELVIFIPNPKFLIAKIKCYYSSNYTDKGRYSDYFHTVKMPANIDRWYVAFENRNETKDDFTFMVSPEGPFVPQPNCLYVHRPRISLSYELNASGMFDGKLTEPELREVFSPSEFVEFANCFFSRVVRPDKMNQFFPKIMARVARLNGFYYDSNTGKSSLNSDFHLSLIPSREEGALYILPAHPMLRYVVINHEGHTVKDALTQDSIQAELTKSQYLQFFEAFKKFRDSTFDINLLKPFYSTILRLVVKSEAKHLVKDEITVDLYTRKSTWKGFRYTLKHKLSSRVFAKVGNENYLMLDPSAPEGALALGGAKYWYLGNAKVNGEVIQDKNNSKFFYTMIYACPKEFCSISKLVIPDMAKLSSSPAYLFAKQYRHFGAFHEASLPASSLPTPRNIGFREGIVLTGRNYPASPFTSRTAVSSSSSPVAPANRGISSFKQRRHPSFFLPPMTFDDGDCAFHSVLGVLSDLTNRYECKNVADKRNEVANRIMESKQDHDEEIYRLTKASILEQLMNPAGNLSNTPALHTLKSAYEDYLKKNNEEVDAAFLKLTGLLKEDKEINSYIQGENKENILSFKDKFFHSLNAKGSRLRQMMESDQDICAAFNDYDEKVKKNFDMDPLIQKDPQILVEYTDYIRKPKQWLLPSEVHILALVFERTVAYYTSNATTAKPQIFNPGKEIKVGVRFVNNNHFERVPEDNSPQVSVSRRTASVTEESRDPLASHRFINNSPREDSQTWRPPLDPVVSVNENSGDESSMVLGGG